MTQQADSLLFLLPQGTVFDTNRTIKKERKAYESKTNFTCDFS